ncbi:MAG: MBL fold metallo-hydrolase [Chloroflexi bacterium]|nr:MAG: MBL fold metallo-hydrolase [Chloroflexota bacterium]TME46742.1 MAG: MBL fold metallo-hydrolase [Chloroflexota bacterium]
MLNYPILWDSGIYLPELGLWLDPRQPRPRAVISHAHSDHVAAHPLAYATPATRRLVTHRRPSLTTVQGLEYGQPLRLEHCSLTLHPAGHVLGSAQALIETDWGAILYTGDLKTRSGFTSVPAIPVPADVLLLESTFGKPHYRFPDSAEVIAAIVSWCRSVIDSGATPVLLGYSLGKGQEILSALAAEGIHIALHASLFGVTEVYRELGCRFPQYQVLGAALVRPTVVITPPTARRNGLREMLGEFKTAALTGWAMDPSLKARLEVDAVFPLSDHADFEELCCYAERVGATMTYTVLGFDEELAMHLRRRGIRAKALTAIDQLRLF